MSGPETAAYNQELSKRVEDILQRQGEHPRDEEYQDVIKRLEAYCKKLEQDNQQLSTTQKQLETFYRTAFESRDQAEFTYLLLDQDGVIHDVNSAGASLFQKDRRHLLGHNLALYLAADSKRPFRIMLQTAFTNRTCQELSLHLIRQDGSLFQVRLDSMVLHTADSMHPLCHTIIQELPYRMNHHSLLYPPDSEREQILDKQFELVIYQDAQHRILWPNQSACDAAHQLREQLIGQRCHCVWAQRDQPCENCPVEAAIRTGEMHEAEQTTPEGRTWLIRGYPIQNADGQTIGAIELAQEITSHKHIEQQLQESERRFRTVADFIHDWEYWMDAHQKYVYISPSCQRITGYAADEFVQRSNFIQAITHPDDRERLQHHFQEEFHSSEVFSFDFRIITKQGDERWIEHICQPVYDAEGQWQGRRSSNRDITRRILVEKALGVARDALEQKVEERTEELARTNEELRREIAERKRAETALRQSEACYRAVVEDQTELICRFRANGIITFVNNVYCRYFGKTPQELLNQSFFTLLPEEDLPRMRHHLTTLTQEHPVNTVRHRVIDHSGKIRWQQWTDRAIFDDQGELIEYQSIGRDITAQIKSEEERAHLLKQIQEQAQLLLQVVTTVPEGVLLLDTKGRIILSNPVAETDLQLLTGEDFTPPLTQFGNRPLEELLVYSPRGIWHKVMLDTPKPMRFEINARPLGIDANAEIWVMVIRDVTQEWETRQRIQQQERLASIGQLAAGIAHDFNNIMAVIILYAHLLSQESSIRNHRWLSTIEKQAQRASDLTQQILDFSRHAVIERRPLNLVPFLKEQTKLLQRILPGNITIHFASQAEEYTIKADPTRIQQIIMNLAHNARDSMPDGGSLFIALSQLHIANSEQGPLPEITEGTWICLKIRETGTGIPQDILPHIFEPFFTTKSPGKGSGLGLAQVYGIVKQHEGHIDVKSQVGEGTTFFCYFPALPVKSASNAAVSLNPKKGHGETVLVVENNDATRAALVDTLKILNYHILEAQNGREALKLLDQPERQIRLLLTDVVMPEMGGIALFHEIQKRNIPVRVIMLTGHLIEEKLERLRSKGMFDWLSKPVSMEQLAEAVAHGLAHLAGKDGSATCRR